MNGYKFHAEMPEARKSKGASKAYPAPFTRAGLKALAASGGLCNVCAAFGESFLSQGGVMVEIVSAVFSHENSSVACNSASREYLLERTVRIDEATARKLHPALFSYLDRED